MIDIVYPLRKSTWGHTEIKFSIRSLFKHSIEEFGKIFIVGDKPEFFEYNNKLIHIPFTETQAAEVNIWEKVLRVAQDERASDYLFFMNDDFFFVEDFVMSEFPNFHKGNLAKYPWARLPIPSLSGYTKKAAITLKLLSKLKLSTWFYDIHTPAIIEKEKFINTYNYFKPHLYKGTGLLIYTCYGNYNKWEPTERADLKIGKKGLTEYLNSQKNLLFSIADSAQGQQLLEFFETTYIDKSPVEK